MVLQFEILGRLRVLAAGAELDLGPVQRQVVLAVLLLRPNQPMSRAHMIESIWGADAPTYAANLLQKHVSALRRVLEPDRSDRQPSRLSWTSAGYRLSVPAGSLDLDAFESQASRARMAQVRGDLRETGEALREALRMWRGPLCDGLTGPLMEAERDRLAERRLAMLEERLDVDLEQGLHADVVAELRQLVQRHPLRERLTELLMTALYRSGRQAEALATYQQTRGLLHDELGIDPAASLQRLHRQILNADPALAPGVGSTTPSPRPATPVESPVAPIPAQLPHGLPELAGRRAELTRLHALAPVDPPENPHRRTGIVAIDGTAGAGKTTLAVHWAHQISHRFPDGQLYVNLRGFDPSGAVMAPADAIRVFLDAFAVPTHRLPASLDAQAALYRSHLAGKRVLVILDNARDAEQIRPLLPGTPGCLVIITSRNRLTSLVVTEGARPITVGLLSKNDARYMLASRIGPVSGFAEPEATDEIIRLCARLPLALAIVAARAAVRPEFPLAVLADELRRQRGLEAFDDDDVATDVRAVFSWSYRALDAAVGRLFRLLGSHPGPHWSIASASSLAGMRRDDTRRALAELTRANLVEEPVPGRYAFHDLLRAYAGELVAAQESDGERLQARRRVLDHYLYTARAADLLIDPHDDALDLPAPPAGVIGEDLDGREGALVWFAIQHPVLLAAVDQAAAAGLDTHTWQLAHTMATFLHRHGHWHDQVTLQSLALKATQRTHQPAYEAQVRCSLARAHSQLGRNEEAHRQLRHALDLYAEQGNPTGQAQTHMTLARVLYRQGRHQEALELAQQALQLYRQTGHRGGEGAALNAVGWFHALMDDHHMALTCCQEALDLHLELDDAHGAAAALDSLGYAHHHLGQYVEATSRYQEAVEGWRRAGDLFMEADTLGRLGDTLLAAGDTSSACVSWQEARTILEGLHHPDAELLLSKIDGATNSVCA